MAFNIMFQQLFQAIQVIRKILSIHLWMVAARNSDWVFIQELVQFRIFLFNLQGQVVDFLCKFL
ncbi:MAG: hypothetical protein VR77_11910 [Flavobacteriales bacterium BRH_c54]|nr:MAG: hypothetical protein VR77_11910 [Flavobacteriales bacterium BRH_c54]